MYQMSLPSAGPNLNISVPRRIYLSMYYASMIQLLHTCTTQNVLQKCDSPDPEQPISRENVLQMEKQQSRSTEEP